MGDNKNAQFNVIDDDGGYQVLTDEQLAELSKLEDTKDETMLVLGKEVIVPKQDDGRKLISCHDVMRALGRIEATTPVEVNAKARGLVLVQAIIDFIGEHVAEPEQGGRGIGRGRGRGGGHSGRGRGTVSDTYVCSVETIP
jgi:hypothetical protein